MALFFAYSFEHWDASLSTIWRELFPTQAGAAPTATYSGRTAAANMNDFKQTTDIKTWPASWTSGQVIFDWYRTSGSQSGSNIPLIRLRNGATVHMQITANWAGTFDIIYGGATVATGVGAWSVDTWYTVKIDFTLHDSTGEFHFWLDTTQIHTATGVDTKNGSSAVIENVFIGGGGGNAIASFILGDKSGTLWTSIDNAVTYEIELLLPNGAGTSTQWTPSTGDNYSCVNENPYSETKFVESDTDTHKDTYELSDLTGIVEDILGVCPFAIGENDDATARSLNTVVRHETTEAAGTDQALTNSNLNYIHSVQVVSPHTTSDWQVSQVNAMRVGFELSK